MEAKPELKYIFININEWLKFAETKHAGLVVLNAGLVVGILSSYPNIQYFILKPTIVMGIICFGISVYLSIISQFPVTQQFLHKRRVIENPNLYFFGHLAHFDIHSFIEEIKKVDKSFAPTRFDADLINQILANSRIAEAKYQFFKYASYLTAFGSGLIGLSTIIKILWHF